MDPSNLLSSVEEGQINEKSAKLADRGGERWNSWHKRQTTAREAKKRHLEDDAEQSSAKKVCPPTPHYPGAPISHTTRNGECSDGIVDTETGAGHGEAPVRPHLRIPAMEDHALSEYDGGTIDRAEESIVQEPKLVVARHSDADIESAATASSPRIIVNSTEEKSPRVLELEAQVKLLQEEKDWKISVLERKLKKTEELLEHVTSAPRYERDVNIDSTASNGARDADASVTKMLHDFEESLAEQIDSRFKDHDEALKRSLREMEARVVGNIEELRKAGKKWWAKQVEEFIISLMIPIVLQGLQKYQKYIG